MAVWQLSGTGVPLDRTRIMGILNCTPDSFSDGGLYQEPARAAALAERLIREGADILDIGAQSTRPGASLLSADEEWARLAPVLAAVRRRVAAPLTIDTFHPEVARLALENGADGINDVSGGLLAGVPVGEPERANEVGGASGEPESGMLALAAAYGAGVVLMRPGDAAVRDGGGLVAATAAFFAGAVRRAAAAGLDPRALCLDPGVGFGSSAEEDAALIARLPETLAGLPEVAVLVGASRKRVTGAELPPGERLAGTIACHTVAVWQGAHIIRVHDVAEAARAAVVVDALRRQRK